MTTKEEAIGAIYMGQLVKCEKLEYENELRSAIQDQAGKWIDHGDGLRAMMALDQVKRLDKLFGTMQPPQGGAASADSQKVEGK